VEVTIETEESIVFRTGQAPRSISMWCPECRREVEMVTPEQAPGIVGVSPRAIYASVESRKVHFSEMPKGLLLVCLDSLTGLKAGLDR